MSISPREALRALNAFKEATKGSVAAPDEVQRRADICDKCPQRVYSANWQSTASRILGILANKHRVPKALRDFSCGVCKCSMMLLLPATPKDFHRDTPEEHNLRPDQCWMKQQTQQKQEP